MTRTCIITGAAGTLGRALCRRLMSTSNVISVYHKNLPDSAISESRVTIAVEADLTDKRDIERLCSFALRRFGRIDTLVHAAADIRFLGRFVDSEAFPTDVYRQFAINVVAPAVLTSHVFHTCWKESPLQNRLRARNVAFISSVSALGVKVDRGQVFYSASKAALLRVAEAAAIELEPYGVRVHTFVPARFRGDRAEELASQISRALDE